MVETVVVNGTSSNKSSESGPGVNDSGSSTNVGVNVTSLVTNATSVATPLLILPT